MYKSSMIRGSYELENIDRGIRVGRNRVAQVRIEIRQPRAVDDQIQILLQTASRLAIESEPRPGNIPFDHLDLVPQKIEKPVPVALKQRIEYRRVFHHFFETALRRIRLLPPDQQINSLHVRQIQKCVRQPDFANEPGDADQHDLLSGE